jgi:3-oxoacyl-[acyl-carrier-protein] synthase III
MSNSVYITKISKFLPNAPIDNNKIEDYLGMICGEASKSQRIVLRRNGIKTRYYALDEDQNVTHTNADMVAEAVKNLTGNGFDIQQLELLACGTSTPDQIIPSHASMVHGKLIKSRAVEIVSLSGVCCSGINALKYAYLAVGSGDKKNAVATGSERVSICLLAKNYEEECRELKNLKKAPIIAFEKDFLRWMLSDGAGAALISNRPNKEGISLKIAFIDMYSFAHEVKTCMYMGANKLGDGDLKGWCEYDVQDWLKDSIFSLKQDIKLLDTYVVSLGIKKMKQVLEERNISVSEIDYFLPHMSSEFFRYKIADEMEMLGIGIPQEKWFSNLEKVGNVGSASIYLMIEELCNSGNLKKGDKIFLLVPESARFSYAYSLLTVC